VTAGWQKKWRRLSQMNGTEVRVRATQEFHKRRDLLFHRLGIRQAVITLSSATQPGIGRFFFSEREAPERAGLLAKHLPEQAAAVLREADEICARRFRLLGYENLSFHSPGGNRKFNEIDWHLDPLHGKRAPLEPWFRIPFLDFAVVGDHKVTWELNRHQHLVVLAKAFLLSGDEKYIRELIAQWHSWIEANPYPLGINWGSSLEVAFRSLSWIWIDHLLAEATGSAQTENKLTAFRAELLSALAFHGRYIERYLSSYFSPNTHLIGEAAALFFLGTLYPQIPHAMRWARTGWEILVNEAGRQVRPDGVYFEQSLYYHVYALDFFLYARLLATLNNVEIPPAFDATLQKMLGVVEALAQDGPPEGFGDDDGGRLFNPRRNRTEQMTDPLALGALLYSREYSAAQLTEESIWLFGDEAIQHLTCPPPNQAPVSQAFPDGGIYVIADAQPYPLTIMIDAGPQGVGRSGHGHADALSLRLTMSGRRWLVDSGSGVYIAKNPADRNTFRGTGAHNTMRIDGLDQAIADEPFSWKALPTTVTETWITGTSFTYFVGSHNGYSKLPDPVTHRRYVLKIAGDLWLVRDVALGHSEHGVEVRWHFAPDLEVQAIAAGRVEISSSTSSEGDAGLTMMVPEDTVWQTATEVTRTVISPAYGALESAPLVKSHARVRLPAELGTLLTPHGIRPKQQAILRPDVSSNEPRFASMTMAGVQVYELAYSHVSYGFFFSPGDRIWSFGPWSSNAQMLYCGIEGEKLDHLVVVGGTEVGWQGEPLLKAVKPSRYFEWRKQDSVMDGSGEFSFTPLFETLTGEQLHEVLPGRGRSPVADFKRDSSSYAEKH
jgi:hypothetical protein